MHACRFGIEGKNMFGWLKSLGKPIDPEERALREKAKNEAIKRGTLRAAEKDRFAIPRVTGLDLYNNMADSLTTERGVHMESLLCGIGSLAGFTCGRIARHRAKNTPPDERTDSDFVAATNTDTGAQLYFGDWINGPLCEDQSSFWSQVAGTAESLGETNLPDIGEIFEHVSNSAFSDEFGIPRVRSGRSLLDTPTDFVRNGWAAYAKVLTFYSNDPWHFPLSWGLAAQQAMQDGQNVIPPGEAAEILMECAIPMSKIGPEHVPEMEDYDLFTEQSE